MPSTPPAEHDQGSWLRRAAARHWPILAITAVALLLRLWFYLDLVGHPMLEMPVHWIGNQTDMGFYWSWASQVLAGDWLGRDTPHPYMGWMKPMGDLETWYRWWGGREIFQSEPGYTYTLAVLRGLGLGLPQIILLQLVLGALAPALMYAAMRPVFGRLASACAGLLLATYGTLIFYNGALLRDWTVTLIDPVLLAALLWAGGAYDAAPRGDEVGGEAEASGGWNRRLRWGLAGVAIGVAMWIKSTVMVFLPLLVLWVLWRHRRAGTGPAAWALALLALGFGVGLSPLIARNVAVGAPPMAVSNRPIEGFAVANANSEFSSIGFAYDPGVSAEILEAADGSTSAVIVETLKTYRGEPWAFVERFWTKFRGLMDPFEVPNNLSVAFGREQFASIRYLPGWWLVVPLAAVGLLAAAWPGRGPPGRGRFAGQSLFLLYGLACFVSAITLYVLARYRLTLLPFTAVYAGVGLAWLVELGRGRAWRRLAAAGATLALVSWLQLGPLALPELRERPGYLAPQVSYWSSLVIAAERGDADLVLALTEAWRDRLEGVTGGFADAERDKAWRMEASTRMRVIEDRLAAGDTGAALGQAAAYRAARRQIADPSNFAPAALPFAQAGRLDLAGPLAVEFLAAPAEAGVDDMARRVCRQIVAAWRAPGGGGLDAAAP